jgi:hypothetical protein
MEGKRRRRAVEALKNLLIVLLSCSALWLTFHTPLAAPLRGLLQEEGPQAVPGQSQSAGRVEAAVPMAMAANLPSADGMPEGDGRARFGALYHQNVCQELFQQVVSPLAESLSGAGAPEQVTDGQWQRVLAAGRGVYIDFQGQIPIPVLAGWLSGGETALTATVRRLMLVAREDGIDLYYRDERDGSYYRCRARQADPAPLEEALSGLTDNGAFYAFESELYAGLDPDTLLLPEAPVPAVYTAVNPVSASQGALRDLVRDLGFSVNSTSFYSTDEQVARSGDDSVRLSDRGVAQYVYEGREGVGLFPVLRQGGQLFDSVETCRQIALSAMGSRCGEARLYLLSARQTDQGLEVDFGYSLNGVPVLLDQGYAARFLVSEGQVVQFSMYLRGYTASGDLCLVLPPRQGAAALEARGLERAELLLTYTDSGGDTVQAGWSAKEAEGD